MFGGTIYTGVGALSNVRLAKTANYTVVNADKAKTIACASGPWTLTFSAASGYDSNFAVLVLNEGATRGINIAPNGLTSFWLYPGQSALIYNQNNVWQVHKDSHWKLTAALTVYVDGTNGNAANDGLANGAGNAVATFAQARDLLCQNVNFNGQTVTIQFANGTYTAPIELQQYHNWVGSGNLLIAGDTTTPSNVTISNPGSWCVIVVGFKSGQVKMQGFKVTNNAGYGIIVTSASFLTITGKMEFGACSSAAILAQSEGSIESLSISHTISGASPQFMLATNNGYISFFGGTWTVTGTPAFSTAFAQATKWSSIVAESMTFSGSATGKRYDVAQNSNISVAGGGANYFPGNSAGTTATGGQYN